MEKNTELFFRFGAGVTFELLEEGRAGAKTVSAVQWVFEKEGFERLQSEGHVAAEEDEETEAREILEDI